MRTASGSGGQVAGDQASEFQAHAVEKAEQLGGIYAAESERIEDQMQMGAHNRECKSNAGADQCGGKARPVGAGLNHQELEGDRHTVEITAERTQIAAEDLAALAPELSFEAGRESWLALDKPQFFLTEQTEHRTVPFRRELIDPFQRRGQLHLRTGNAANQDDHG